MPGWNGSNRRDRLPANWNKIRERILRRDNYECQQENPYGAKECPEPATDVDHIIPGDDHSDVNLQSLCDWHHKQKSGAEGAAAARARRQKIDRKFRRTEEHPGLM
ncbi:HNH endonuclease [Kribbella sindirgiensis]|uniref:HNH endonuclease n=1 Tax=Kribbella sindirgiensis TaxID=1124744 RepID=A0A4R0I518_9ACTN|nr:HNH endonuclease [Kribbella sindirgiensis]TCC19953.1 HNH endonuclease [Kribbella sindirgiensis]